MKEARGRIAEQIRTRRARGVENLARKDTDQRFVDAEYLMARPAAWRALDRARTIVWRILGPWDPPARLTPWLSHNGLSMPTGRGGFIGAAPRDYGVNYADPYTDEPSGFIRVSPPAIRTEGLTKRYGQTLALDHVDLSVEPGQVFGFLGPNGAGKTTTLRLLLGLHRASSGRAELFGIDAWSRPVEAHRRVAYVAGEPTLWPGLTGAETLEFLGRLHGNVDHAYRTELIDRFALEPDKKLRALSKGNRQKIQLIAALCTRAELLLLDEPTSGLDPLMEMAFRHSINEARERAQTVFLSSHMLSQVEAICDRVGILRRGQLVDEGTLSELSHLRGQTLEATFPNGIPTLPELPGVSVSRAGPGELRFEVTGELTPLLRELAGHGVTTLRSHAPTLEEVFLHHYDQVAEPATAGGNSDGRPIG